MAKAKIWLKRVFLTMSATLVLSIASLLIYQQFSDGPTGPLPGSTFSSGEAVNVPVTDWTELEGDFEFELIGQGTSRTAGGILVNNQLYITCDLGFIWSRLPSGFGKVILNTIWVFKDWHEEAMLDGRIRIRKNGRVHTASIKRVEDPHLIEELKGALETLAGEYFKDTGLGPRPTEEPNDIWFFRVAQ